MSLFDFLREVFRAALFAAWLYIARIFSLETSPRSSEGTGSNPHQPGSSPPRHNRLASLNPSTLEYQAFSAPYQEYKEVLGKSTPYRWPFNEEYAREYPPGAPSEYSMELDYLGFLSRLYGVDDSVYQTWRKKYQI